MRSRLRSPRCARIPRRSAARPGSRSAATGFATRSAATSPSTACPSTPVAAGMITAAGSTVSLANAFGSSATPTHRTPEDYFPILRFSPFHAAYGAGEPDRAGYLACIAARAGLASLSAERVRMEMLKLMVAQGAPGAITAMADGGLLLPIFGGVAYTGPFTAMISAEHLLGLKPDPVRRLGALAVAVTEDRSEERRVGE